MAQLRSSEARLVALRAAYWGEAAAPVCVSAGQPLTYSRPNPAIRVECNDSGRRR
jgi:hypothetical protein